MNGTNNLEIALQQTSWEAVSEAKRLGENALPIIKKYGRDEDYQKRQIAVACAGVIDDDGIVPILTAELDDDNVNVRLETAKAINKNPMPGVTDAVLEKLENSQEDVLKEFLALAAGKLPGEKTIEVLKRVEKAEEGQVSENAQMALAKLGDTESKEAIVKDLSDALPRTRYDALEKFIYIGDPALASYAKRLLADKSDAAMIGIIRRPRYRRVCDQAVDTIVFLLNLITTFAVGKDKIYSDGEIQEVESKGRRN
jgi:HEAT repeat protein